MLRHSGARHRSSGREIKSNQYPRIGVARHTSASAASAKPILVAAALAFLLISWTPRHHWDEFFYLFSAMAHSPRELVQYETRLAIFPDGFFSGKIGHVVLLRLLLTVLGTGRVSLFIVQSFYALLLLAFAASALALLRELVDRRIALRSTVVLLLLPVTTYLGFKTLSEVPSVLLSTLGCWGFVRSFREPSGRGRQRWLALAVAGLALGGLSRVTGFMEFLGLTLGLLAMKDRRFPSGEVVRRALL